MNIIVVDDERPTIQAMERALQNTLPTCTLTSFTKPSDAITYTRNHKVDIAFLDIQMPTQNGLSLAKELKDIHPKINIIFVTGHTKYTAAALQLRVSGYIMKPITEHSIQTELDNLRHPVDLKSIAKVYVQCFGSFEVYINGKPLAFKRSKAKELFAFLVDRRGASVKTSDIAAVLWEDQPYDRARLSNTTMIVSSLIRTFREAGLNDIIIKRWNSLSVDCSKFDCDFYQLLQGDAQAVNAYMGEYMSNYSWAEMTTGTLNP